MMPPTKPTILFIPGAWHTPEAFDTVRELLHQRGFETDSVALPSIGAEPPTKTLSDDVAAVAGALRKLVVEDEKQVVVVAHSYGGLVGSGAVEGLGYAARARAGESGGVIMLMYMAAFIVPKGKSLWDMLGGKWQAWMKFEGDYSYPSEEERVFYNDLSPAEQKKWIAKLKHSSAACFSAPCTYEPWHDMPCMYLFCEKDAGLPIFVQEAVACMLGEYTSFRCDGSHSPFLSMPEKVVEAVELAVADGRKKSVVSA